MMPILLEHKRPLKKLVKSYHYSSSKGLNVTANNKVFVLTGGSKVHLKTKAAAECGED